MPNYSAFHVVAQFLFTKLDKKRAEDTFRCVFSLFSPCCACHKEYGVAVSEGKKPSVKEYCGKMSCFQWIYFPFINIL